MESADIDVMRVINLTRLLTNFPNQIRFQEAVDSEVGYICNHITLLATAHKWRWKTVDRCQYTEAMAHNLAGTWIPMPLWIPD